MRKSDNLVYSLSKKNIVFLFVYFSMLLVGGLVGVAIVLINYVNCETNSNYTILYTIIASFSASSMLNSIQYIKRLYKACITDRINTDSTSVKRIGNMIYFLLRPLFSFAFCILMILALFSGMFFVIGNLDFILNDKFLYLCTFMSSIIGFSTGKVIDRFEKAANERIKKLYSN